MSTDSLRLIIWLVPIYWSVMLLNLPPVEIPAAAPGYRPAFGFFLSEDVSSAEAQMKTLMVQMRPLPCSLLFDKARAQTHSPISDWLRCSSPLIVPPAVLLSVCGEKKTKNDENILIPICIYSSLHDELKNSFLLIPWIICSLCINHCAPSGRCRRHSVRNSHSDLN